MPKNPRNPFLLDVPQPLICALGLVVYAGIKYNSFATYAHAPPPDFFRMTPHHLLVYTLEGQADYKDSTGLRTVLKKGDMLWTPMGVDQSYGPQAGSRWSELCLWLSGPTFDQWQAHGLPGQPTRLVNALPVHAWCERFIDILVDSRGHQSDFERFCRFQLLLAEAFSQPSASRLLSSPAWFDSSCTMLSEGRLTNPPLEAIARRSGVPYALFRRQFTECAGRSPGMFRSEAIFRRACHRLGHTDESIFAIAEELGFHDQFHFSRRFRAAIGMSPREYRRLQKR